VDPNYDWRRTYERVKKGGVATPEDLARIIPPMGGGAGEAWQQIVTIGKETTAGTAVPTTRKLYGMTNLSRTRATNLVKVNTGTRDNQRDAKVRSVQMAGTFDQPISAEEILELLAMTLKTGVTPTAVISAATPAAPTPTGTGSGSTLPPGLYTLTVTQWSALGETLPSATATVTTTGTQTISVVGPALGSGMTNTNVYLSPVGVATPRLYAGTATGTTVVVSAPPALTAPQAPTAVAQKWVFTPSSTAGATVDTATWEFFDGYRNWQARGVLVDTLALSGVISADTKLAATLFGQEMTPNTATSPPAERLPDFIEGWEAQLFIDAYGGTPGTTNIPGTMINWDTSIKNQATRKYFADNTTAAGAVILGELGIQSTFMLEGNASALAEYNFRDSATKRLIRVQLGNNRAVAGGQNGATKKVMIDLPGAWTAIDLTPEDAGTKTFKFTQDYTYDVVNSFGVQVTAINSRSALYSAA
jgi:hypothetical protein